MMMRNKQRVKYYEVDSNYGHDAFLVELDKFDRFIREELEDV